MPILQLPKQLTRHRGHDRRAPSPRPCPLCKPRDLLGADGCRGSRNLVSMNHKVQNSVMATSLGGVNKAVRWDSLRSLASNSSPHKTFKAVQRVEGARNSRLCLRASRCDSFWFSEPLNRWRWGHMKSDLRQRPDVLPDVDVLGYLT